VNLIALIVRLLCMTDNFPVYFDKHNIVFDFVWRVHAVLQICKPSLPVPLNPQLPLFSGDPGSHQRHRESLFPIQSICVIYPNACCCTPHLIAHAPLPIFLCSFWVLEFTRSVSNKRKRGAGARLSLSLRLLRLFLLFNITEDIPPSRSVLETLHKY